MSDKWKRSQVKMKNSAVLGKLQFWLPTTSVEMLRKPGYLSSGTYQIRDNVYERIPLVQKIIKFGHLRNSKPEVRI